MLLNYWNNSFSSWYRMFLAELLFAVSLILLYVLLIISYWS